MKSYFIHTHRNQPSLRTLNVIARFHENLLSYFSINQAAIPLSHGKHF